MEEDAARWPNYQEVGEAKPGATMLVEVTPAGKQASPLLVTAELRPRPHGAVRHRRKLALADAAADLRGQDPRDVLAADAALAGGGHAGAGRGIDAEAGAVR